MAEDAVDDDGGDDGGGDDSFVAAAVVELGRIVGRRRRAAAWDCLENCVHVEAIGLMAAATALACVQGLCSWAMAHSYGLAIDDGVEAMGRWPALAGAAELANEASRMDGARPTMRLAAVMAADDSWGAAKIVVAVS